LTTASAAWKVGEGGDLNRVGIAAHDVEADLQHGLAGAVGQVREVHVGPQIAAPPSRAQRLQHRLQDCGGPSGQHLGEFGVGTGAFVERHLQRGAVRHRAHRDGRTQLGDLGETDGGLPLVEALHALGRDAVQVGVVAQHQLDEQGFLGFEVVVQAARQNPCGVGDFL
jgi:hypothetical protein